MTSSRCRTHITPTPVSPQMSLVIFAPSRRGLIGWLQDAGIQPEGVVHRMEAARTASLREVTREKFDHRWPVAIASKQLDSQYCVRKPSS